ncbi:transmembrane protein 14 homolog [Topomyia yanbarensis]|uniref:transmembrane protein 14 homolog n=1 Tax=Topomyia yanbarensis TaxID=2498891 RepID=UPI00273B42F5|nr:transmembrane protein 14 homolog [Topomyia yanbarensis]
MIDFVGIIFALIVAGGGIFGYVKAGSVPSLIAGVSFGLLLGVGAYFNSTENPIPLIQIIILVLLVAMMGFRWIRGGNFMPAGLITVLSVAVLVWTCVMYRDYLPFVSKPEATDEAARIENVRLQQ